MRGMTVAPLCPALRRQSGGGIGAFIPQCEEDGSFSTVQCWGSTGYCWCVESASGRPVTEGIRGEPECPGKYQNIRNQSTFPLLIKLICTCTCTRVSCNNSLYCEWRYLSIWREIHRWRRMQYMVRCGIKVLELIILMSTCNTSLASAQALEWLCVPVRHVHQVRRLPSCDYQSVITLLSSELYGAG